MNLKSLVESKLFPIKEAIPAQLGDELVNLIKSIGQGGNWNRDKLHNLMGQWFIGPNSTAEKVDIEKLKKDLVGKNADKTNYYILTKDGKPLVAIHNGQVYQEYQSAPNYGDYRRWSMTALSKIADGAWRVTPDMEIVKIKDERRKMQAAMGALAGMSRKQNFLYDREKPYDDREPVMFVDNKWKDAYGKYSDSQIAEFIRLEGFFVEDRGSKLVPADGAQIQKAKENGRSIPYSERLYVKVPEIARKKDMNQVQAYPNAETRKELNAKLREMMLAYRDKKIEDLRTEYNNLYPELADAAVTGDREKENKVQNKLNGVRNALSYLKELSNKLPGEQKKWDWGNETYNLEYKNAKEMMDMFNNIRRDIDRQINNIKTGESW